MAATPTLTPARLKAIRFIVGLTLVALGGASVAFADHAPWLGAIATGIGWAAGKYFAIPVADVIKLGLQLMTPERAVDVAVSALQSMPAGHTAAATERLFASLPPAMRARASVAPSHPGDVPTTIQFIDDGIPDDGGPGAPVDPSGAPIPLHSADEVTRPTRARR